MLGFLLINILIVLVAVLIYAKSLYFLTSFVPTLAVASRVKVIISVFIVILAHVLEVFIFAASYYSFIHFGQSGSLHVSFDGSFLDSVYFSFITYTSLAIGDIIPHGNIRFLVGLEALSGLVLITWSASFLYIEMQKFWKIRTSKP